MNERTLYHLRKACEAEGIEIAIRDPLDRFARVFANTWRVQMPKGSGVGIWSTRDSLDRPMELWAMLSALAAMALMNDDCPLPTGACQPIVSGSDPIPEDHPIPPRRGA